MIINHKTFNEYHQKQDDLRLVVERLVANDHDVDESNVQVLMEAGFFDKIKQYGKKAALGEGLGKNLLAYGLMSAGALGAAGCSGGKCSAPPSQSPSKIEKFSDYMTRTKDMYGKERTEEWERRMARKQAERQKGTPKELGKETWTSPDAAAFAQ